MPPKVSMRVFFNNTFFLQLICNWFPKWCNSIYHFSKLANTRTVVFSVITEYTGFIAVRVDFVVRPRNGSGMISRIRSTRRTCRSGQAIAGDVSTAVIAGITVTGSHLHVICNHAPGGPGCLTQWRRASSSHSCLTLSHSEKSVLIW